MINDLVRKIVAGDDGVEPRGIDAMGAELLAVGAGEGAMVLAPPSVGLTTRLVKAYPLYMFVLGEARSALCLVPTQALAYEREREMSHLQQRLGSTGEIIYRPYGGALNGIDADLVLLDWFRTGQTGSYAQAERDIGYFLSILWMRRGPRTRFLVGGNTCYVNDPLIKMSQAMYNNGDRILRFDALTTKTHYDQRGDKHVSTYSLDHVRWPVREYEKIRKQAGAKMFESAFNHSWLSDKLRVTNQHVSFTEYKKDA